MRNGKYGKYKGKEYRISEESNDMVVLVSNDSHDLKIGFEKYARRPSVLTKRVNKRELEGVYQITSFAMIDGMKFEIIGVDQNEVVIYTYDESIAKKYNMERTGIHEYKKALNINDVKVFEEKNLIEK